MTIKDIAKTMKCVSPILSNTSHDMRLKALKNIQKALLKNKENIFNANQQDLEEAKKNDVSDAVLKRLKFDEGKLQSVIEGIDQLMILEDPVGKTYFQRELDENLILNKISTPLGVIGVIFEARPDALVQISTLCIKSGNCAILKGGKETKFTNQILFDLIYKAAIHANLPEHFLNLATTHSEIDELLTCEEYIDLIIPRGSNAFVQYIMTHTKIPVMGHADGVCTIYVDKDYDPHILVPIIIDAKTQYTAACNTVETILIHQDVAKEVIDVLKEAYEKNRITAYGNEDIQEFMNVESVDTFHKEYLDLKLSMKIVKDVDEAINHINTYGSHHTDAIISENEEAISMFTSKVDSAGVYVNVSTRFADGFRYGFGAEVGVSTSKLHARGPVGLDGLMTYKYILTGHGQIVDDYAKGKSHFHFKELR